MIEYTEQHKMDKEVKLILNLINLPILNLQVIKAHRQATEIPHDAFLISGLFLTLVRTIHPNF